MSELMLGQHQLGTSTIVSRGSLTSPATDTLKAALYLTSATIDAGPRQDVNCTFLWSNGSTNVSSIIANQAGIYWVRYGNNLCAVSDTIELYNCPELTVPNVFTPNGDGFNDLFIPEAQSISTFKMTIYNRWGEKIFTTEDYIHGWDGTISKNEAADGVYFWVIEYKERGNQSDSKVLYGSVTLIR
jgi:gliding motility-associated-like protein